jgi:PKD repeat protein
MKHLSTLNARRGYIVLTFLCIFSLSRSYGQLSGTYTIGGSGASYSSFSAAISDLHSKGVNGPVVFKVASGTYTEQDSIGKITGASATNTITFQPATTGDSTKVVLTSASSTSTNKNYTLQLCGSRYINISEITISRTGTALYSVAVYLTSNTYTCKFTNCLMKTKVDPTTATTGFGAGSPVFYSVGIDSNNVYTNNRLKFGFNGFCFGSTGYNNKVIGNIVDSAGCAGVYSIGNQNSLLISGNTFNMGIVYVSGLTHYVSYGVRFESSTNYKIIKNKFYSTSSASVCRCVAVFGSATTTGNRNLIANNFLWVSAGSSSSTGITLGGGTTANIDVVYNNVLITSTPTNSAALYIYPQYTGAGIVIMNNNLVNKGTGTCIDNSNASTSYSTGVATEKYNNLYTKGTYTGNYKGTLYTTLSAWQSGTSLDTSSIATDPGYVSSLDMHESSAAVYQAGTPISSVTDDIDGDARPSSKPCIGADEFVPLYWDAGVTSLDSPAYFCYPTTKNIVVKFTNFGVNTITGVIINWSVNGVGQSPYLWSGSVATGTVSSQITIGSYNFTTKNPYAIKIWTSSPNGNSDQKHTNDTLVKSLASGLSGTYTLGGTSPDFNKFNDVVDAITLRGMCGPTVIKVRNGTYGEQISIPNFAALNSTNTLMFQSEGGDSSKVILTLASASATGVNNAVVQLKGCQYVTFKQITISKTVGSGTLSQVIELTNGAKYNNFINCRLLGVVQTYANTTGDVVISDSATSTTESNNTFINNAIRYGTSAFNLNGQWASHATGTEITGNQIDSTYATAINVLNEDGVKIKRNTITNNISYLYSGIMVSRSSGAIDITGNKVIMPYGAFAGIYLFYSNGTSGSTGIIANNYVSIGTGTLKTPRGLLDSLSSYQNFYYNTVDIYNTNTGSCFYLNASSGNVNAVDNIFYNAGGGYTIRIPVTSSISVGNYNDYYTTGTNMGLWGTTYCKTLSDWKTASSMSANSVAINPLYLSNTDCHTVNPNLIGLGTPISGITTDINGITRSATAPSMGSCEIKIAGNEAGVSSIVNPTGATICGGPTSIQVTLKNYGSKTLTSAKIGWSVNGVAQTAYSFSGSISPSSSATVTIGTFNISASSTTIKTWSSLPNGILDSLPSDDTTSASYSVNPAPAANAGTSTSICTGKNTTIGATAVTGNTYSWISNPAGFTSTTSNPSVSPTITTTYTLTETITATGCKLSNSVTVTVNPLPAAAAGSNTAICNGKSTTIGATAVTGSTYSWASSPSGFTSTSANPSVSPTTTTIYTVTETNSNGCVNSNSVTVTVNSLPNAAAGSASSICPGQSASIGATAVSGSTYSWVSNPAGFTSTSANPSVSPSVTTVYTVTETNSNGCVNSNSVTVTVNPIPSAVTGPAKTICSGNSFTIGGTAVTGNTYSWTSNPSGFTSSLSNPTVSPTVTTTYTLVESVSSGCSNTNSVTITVNASPAANAGTSTSVCAGSSATIGTTAVSGNTYSWTSTPSGYTSTSSSATVTPSVTTTYILTESNPATGCSQTNTVTITVNPLPAANAGSAVSICNGSSTVIGSTAISGNTYSWSPSTALSSSTVSNPTASPTSTTTYTLTEKVTATGCTKTGTVTVTVNSLPGAAAGSSSTICAGGTASIGSAPFPGSSYSWTSSPAGFTSTSSGPSVSPTVTTVYTVTEKNSAGCTASNSVTITVNPKPVVTVSAFGSTTRCQGDSVILSVNVTSGASYQWKNGGVKITGATNSSYAAKSAGSYYVVVTTGSGCTDSSSGLTVTINPLPSAKITSASTSACSGNTVQLLITSTGAGFGYQWYNNGSPVSGTTTSYFTTQSGNFTARVTNTNGCSALSNNISISINPLPLAKVTVFGSTTKCAGDSVVMIASLIPGNTYQWSKDGTAISGATGFRFAAMQTGNYQLTVTSSLGCSDTASSIPVTFAALPTVPVTYSGSSTVCQGLTVLLRTNLLSASTYSWMLNNVPISGANSNTYAAGTSGNYTVMITSNSTGCSNISSPAVAIKINPISAPVIKVVGNTAICSGSSVILSANTSSDIASYQWSLNSALIAGSTFDTLNASAAGSYTLTTTNTSGCTSTSAPVVISNFPAPTVAITKPVLTTICSSSPIRLHSTLTGNIASKQWMIDGTSVAGATTDSILTTGSGNYTLMVTSTDGCSASASIAIKVNPSPVSSFSMPTNRICSGTQLAFTNKSYVSSGTLSSVWSFGNNDSSKITNPKYIYTTPGTYTVTLVSVASNNCTSRYSDTVQVLKTNISTFTASHIGYRRMVLTANDATGTSYDWNFGDNTLGSGQSPMHQYSADGSYKVSLTVTNANGCSTTTLSTITVNATGIGTTIQDKLSIVVFPNPFKTSTNVVYTLKDNANVGIEVYDMIGKRVAFVEGTDQIAGEHTFVFNGDKPGTYFIRLTVDGQTFVNKVVQQ